MLESLATAAGLGFVGSLAGGPLVVRALDRLVPPARRRAGEWSFIAAALAFAIVMDIIGGGTIGGASVAVVAALPGVIAYLASRQVLASALVSCAPLYFVIGWLHRGRSVHVPAIALDASWPAQPAWMLVYGSLYVFVVLLPLFVVRGRDLVRRTMWCYLAVMLASYACFLLYPTAAPARQAVSDADFFSWTLQGIYSLDVPYNCLPSLHVAYSFVAALACWRVHRGVGIAAVIWAGLIGVSTLFTRQHYVLDVVSGAALGLLAYPVSLRRSSGDVNERDRRRAPARALRVAAIYAGMVAGFVFVYFFTVRSL